MDTPIDDSYWVLPGRLLAGEYPGARDEAGSRLKLSSILGAGVTAFIDLTEEGELRPYASFLPAKNGVNNIPMTYDRIPIEDLGVPTVPEMSVIRDKLHTYLKNEAIVYIHCWGGIGRTGTVVGCYMVQEMGMTGPEALLRIEESRTGTHDSSRSSPETQEQRDMVMGWGSAR